MKTSAWCTLRSPIVLYAVSSFAASCSGTVRSNQAAPPTSRHATPASPSPRDAVDCGSPIPGADPLLRSASLTIFGDFHGTNEIPAFVGRLACHAARAGIAVTVALELARDEQGSLDRYLTSDGAGEARRLLLGGLWAMPANRQDGRRSLAMVDLLESLRKLRASGAALAVFAFDEPAEDRDAAMARNVRAARQDRPDDLFLVLVGNVHAAKVAGTPWDATYVPMGLHLARADPSIRSLDGLLTCGTAWNCTGDSPESLACGVHDIGSRGACEDDSVRVDFSPIRDGKFDGLFSPGTVSASPPANAGR